MKNYDIKGDWNAIKEKIKLKWIDLTEDDLKYERGKTKNLIGRICKRTGKDSKAVSNAIEEAVKECSKK